MYWIRERTKDSQGREENRRRQLQRVDCKHIKALPWYIESLKSLCHSRSYLVAIDNNRINWRAWNDAWIEIPFLNCFVQN